MAQSLWRGNYVVEHSCHDTEYILISDAHTREKKEEFVDSHNRIKVGSLFQFRECRCRLLQQVRCQILRQGFQQQQQQQQHIDKQSHFSFIMTNILLKNISDVRPWPEATKCWPWPWGLWPYKGLSLGLWCFGLKGCVDLWLGLFVTLTDNEI